MRETIKEILQENNLGKRIIVAVDNDDKTDIYFDKEFYLTVFGVHTFHYDDIIAVFGSSDIRVSNTEDTQILTLTVCSNYSDHRYVVSIDYSSEDELRISDHIDCSGKTVISDREEITRFFDEYRKKCEHILELQYKVDEVRIMMDIYPNKYSDSYLTDLENKCFEVINSGDQWAREKVLSMYGYRAFVVSADNHAREKTSEFLVKYHYVEKFISDLEKHLMAEKENIIVDDDTEYVEYENWVSDTCQTIRSMCQAVPKSK